MEGRSLTPLLGGDESGWPERDLYSFSSLLAASLLRGEKKLVIHSLRRPKELEAERLGAMATSARPALYDLRNDPAEHTDLRGDQPELAATMERDLLAHVDRLLLRARGGEETPMDEAFLKALREGGYWEQVRPGGGPEEGGRALPRKGQRPRSPD